ncbi:hypothetical protein ARMSODRAFT_764952 [Armillaria solidipes]|uniref:Peptidase A2 domain-containing protein n=1 Tax=Armillaria solidipes TaxID=1076256 RepID=A0A2H3B7W6_9AGAR|nr:hypothetical protein ARMSODRAFT_764952 [Armillaria solidipes]
MRRLQERPSGCTFLGSKATQTSARINEIDGDIIKVVIDSGSDITLISQESLQAMKRSAKVRPGQKINLIQVTGTSTISQYVNLDLLFETDQGPVKINIDAYVVPGMTTPFILGNDFADQYSISMLRRDDKEGNTFKVRVLPIEKGAVSKLAAHRKSQRIKRRIRLRQREGTVRARRRVVIPPESCIKVLVDLDIDPEHTDIFIESLFCTSLTSPMYP